MAAPEVRGTPARRGERAAGAFQEDNVHVGIINALCDIAGNHPCVRHSARC